MAFTLAALSAFSKDKTDDATYKVNQWAARRQVGAFVCVFLLQQLFREDLISPVLSEVPSITTQLQHLDALWNFKISGY